MSCCSRYMEGPSHTSFSKVIETHSLLDLFEIVSTYLFSIRSRNVYPLALWAPPPPQSG